LSAHSTFQARFCSLRFFFAPSRHRRAFDPRAPLVCTDVPRVFASHLLPGFTGLGFIYYGPICHPQCFAWPRVSTCASLTRPFIWDIGGFPGKSTCPALKPSVLTCRVIQLSGFPISCRVTHSSSQPRFTCVMFQGTPRLPPKPAVRSGTLACW
jgi:hypothetical protein